MLASEVRPAEAQILAQKIGEGFSYFHLSLILCSVNRHLDGSPTLHCRPLPLAAGTSEAPDASARERGVACIRPKRGRQNPVRSGWPLARQPWRTIPLSASPPPTALPPLARRTAPTRPLSTPDGQRSIHHPRRASAQPPPRRAQSRRAAGTSRTKPGPSAAEAVENVPLPVTR